MLKRISKVSASAVSLGEAAMSAMDGGSDHHDDEGWYDYETFGNLSYRRSPVCDGCFCPTSCPDHPMIQRMVRWVKIIARSQHGMTVVCGILPLIFGLLLGFYLGKRSEQHKRHNNQHKEKKLTWPVRTWRLMQAALIVLRFWATSLFLYVMTAKSFEQEKSTGTLQCTEEPTVLISDKERQEQSTHRMLKDSSRYRQSGVDLSLIPQHIAFIMDGNRRYGKSKYKNVAKGHMDGGYKLRDMVHWCIEECVKEITVYAFSTENWNRSPAEIDALMTIFCQQCDELRKESAKLQIVVRVLSTDTEPIPDHVKEKLRQLEEDTKHCRGNLFLNVCLSYGSRGEMVGVCQSLAKACRDDGLAVEDINEQEVESRLLTRKSPPPDILLRTSGEVRISNFLLWQCAYSEFFFLSKHWPDLEKDDLVEVLRSYAHGRKRRYGK